MHGGRTAREDGGATRRDEAGRVVEVLDPDGDSGQRPRGPPRLATASSIADAASSASSASTATKAFTWGLSASMRSRAWVTRARALRWPDRTSAARSVSDSRRKSMPHA